MALSKINIPVITEGGVPNANNLSDEMTKIHSLAVKLTRSNVGNLSYTSPSSGISYNTLDYISEISIYNKGETGLYNLLLKQLAPYMFTETDSNHLQSVYTDTIVIGSTGWVANSGVYGYKLNISNSIITSNSIVSFFIDKEYTYISTQIELCPTTDSYDGGVTIYAKKIPTSNISMSYTIGK